ncbi:AbrB/MazE/SpoVT family DNA-binding domain-containing protein [Lysinibacillus irui]|uniref:AbrB/MazE/SpoVT family DNA-binding domain-containing protein n=1 Tax=Lysinibacillus irui TaxID=2998077 RepID=A0AAJ5RQM5_9BACI|nr:AbrB/MazE/SpoVT family DNA-binding domain-containing protein [Lysinibacillus irui]WDV09276.1 AbrB/MazE/SpoVT family DNA-binding domain-containing protein [Lysinibacillus irui]
MKSTGIVRKLDDLGRVVIPKELRRTFAINIGDALEVFTDDDKIILKKYEANMECFVTGDISDENFLLQGGKLVVSEEGAKILIAEIEKLARK